VFPNVDGKWSGAATGFKVDFLVKKLKIIITIKIIHKEKSNVIIVFYTTLSTLFHFFNDIFERNMQQQQYAM
jgi:hypothetical protein